MRGESVHACWFELANMKIIMRQYGSSKTIVSLVILKLKAHTSKVSMKGLEHDLAQKMDHKDLVIIY